MDLSQIADVDQLKVMAYDHLANLEQTQNNLRAINARIAEVQSASPLVASASASDE
jgi:hypothetical protein